MLLIPKSRDLVRLNPEISGLENFRDPGIRESRDPGIAIPTCIRIPKIREILLASCLIYA